MTFIQIYKTIYSILWVIKTELLMMIFNYLSHYSKLVKKKVFTTIVIKTLFLNILKPLFKP
ncbi:hypothetical protein B0A58_10240 [Flavobacterium branchiophilum NBRC 15030 = ATCC 35035]|nr:hypothetical protein B0A58_10240 [Flavobacterium branchiophilum NBRC 15030 = ATCC 35035]